MENGHSNTNDIRVVLVEDHLLTRIGLRTVLERTNDIKVIGEAENGAVAVQLVRELKPDVVLMDVGMPLLDGIEAARQICAENPQQRIIMLTSHDSEQDIFAALSAGAGGYCLKDVAPDRLYTAVRSIHNGDVWLDSAIAHKVLGHYASEKNVNVRKPVETHPGTNGNMVSEELPSLPEPLSNRELEVLKLLVEGCSNQQIANRLVISLATAKTHVRNILNKLAVDDRTQAAVQAMRRGLV
jgi:DNA-binding NarL/FixJ family response regulator